MRRTEFSNLVLASEEDLDNIGKYRIQADKELLGAIIVGYDVDSSTELSYNGIVKEPTSLRFSGVDDTEYTNMYFTLGVGTAYTRFKETTDLSNNPYYEGGERLRITSSQTVTIKHNTLVDPNNYIFLVQVELKKNKKFDESGINVYFVDRQDSWIVVQMTQAEITSLGSYSLNPNGYVDILSVAAPHLDSQLTNDEKSYTFGAWSSPGGVFTVGSYRVTHYNSIFLGKVVTTGESPSKYKFYHILQGADPLYGVFSRPIFSIIDYVHRNRFGNGTQTDANPHAQALTDFDLYNDTVVDHRNQHHSSGLSVKFSSSLECVINGTTTPDSVTITQLLSGEYLYLQGKRITSVTPLNNSFADNPITGTYYVYIQATSSPTISPTSPYESYIGAVSRASSIPSNAFVLCAVYYDQGTQTLAAYNGDPRYSAASTTNPVTDLRVFGLVGYDKIHSILFESIGKENLVPNGNMEIVENGGIKGWVTGTPSIILPSEGNTSLKLTPGGGTDSSLLFPIDPNVEHSFRIKLHTEGTSSTYQISLFLYRGKNKVRDKVGSFVLSSGTINYSSWTLVESEFLSASTIVWDGSFTTRDNIGYASIELISVSGTLDVDEVIFRPKVRTVDISDGQITTPKVLDGNITQFKLQAAQIIDTQRLVDGNVTTIKLADSSITTLKVDPTSEIGRLAYNGSSYIDSVGDTVGNALRIAFGGSTYYIPANSSPSGPGCGCTCTCTGTCGCTCTCTGTCTCTCKGTSWN